MPEQLQRFNRKHRRKTAVHYVESTFHVELKPLAIHAYPPGWKPRVFELELPLAGLVRDEMAQEIANALGRYLVRFSRATACSRFCAFSNFLLDARSHLVAGQDLPLLSFRTEQISSRWREAFDAHISRLRQGKRSPTRGAVTRICPSLRVVSVFRRVV